MTQSVLWVLCEILSEKIFFLSDFKIVHRIDSRYNESNRCQIWMQSEEVRVCYTWHKVKCLEKSDLKVASVTLLDDAMDE